MPTEFALMNETLAGLNVYALADTRDCPFDQPRCVCGCERMERNVMNLVGRWGLEGRAEEEA